MAISASVGKGGANIPGDVRRVQELLNIARRAEGIGPIKVDGWIGPETTGAILEFQKPHTKIADGRVDRRGSTLIELERIAAPEVERVVRPQLVQILEHLRQAYASRPPAPGKVVAALQRVEQSVSMLPVGAAGGVRSPQQVPGIRAAFAPAIPVAVAAAEAALLATAALIAMLIIIQTLPAMSRTLEKLLREIQLALATALEAVEQAIKEVEDMISRNSRAGMRCSGLIIRFRELSRQIVEYLKGPRPADELGRARYAKQFDAMIEEWRQAWRDLQACLRANGAPI
jgi:hypothetical protein